MLWQTSFQIQIQKQNTCQPFMFPGLFHIWFRSNNSRGDDYQSYERQIQSQTPSAGRKPFQCLRKEKDFSKPVESYSNQNKSLSCTSSRNLRQRLIKPLPIHQGFNNERLTYWFMHINDLQHPLSKRMQAELHTSLHPNGFCSTGIITNRNFRYSVLLISVCPPVRLRND